MRLKNVPGAREAIAESAYAVTDPLPWKGRWRELFGTASGKRAPLHLEIGMGKGRFLCGMAEAHPEICYLGVEKYSSVLVRAVEKQEELALPNLRLIRMDAEEIAEAFAPGEVDRIYLNFSDPWPKDRHAKRRLTSDRFFARYDQILAASGTVEFKTDNRALFDYSLESAEECGWEILAATYDLHRSPMADGNIMTEYEEKFSARGNPICKVIFRRKRVY